MGEFRSFPAESLIKFQMFRERREPFFTANHVRDFHQMIIHNRSKMVRRVPVAFQNDEILLVRVWKSYFPADDILTLCESVSWHLKSDRVRFCFCAGRRVFF